jgi:tryptophan synthase alpha chain
MSARLTQAFARTKAEGRAALIPFIMGGDPDAATSQAILNALPENGADIIELGVPFSDPMADGPVIQAAGLRARAKGTTLKTVLNQVQIFRKTNQQTPIILMGYANPFVQYGLENFALDAKNAGVDGVIIVDVPPEEAPPFHAALKKQSLQLVHLIAPPSLKNRLPMVLEQASGYVYLIAVAGITGSKGADADKVRDYVNQIRAHTKLPVSVGFGIKTPAHVAALKTICDGIVVGSALVQLVANAKQDNGKKALALIHAMSKSLQNPAHIKTA